MTRRGVDGSHELADRFLGYVRNVISSPVLSNDIIVDDVLMHRISNENIKYVLINQIYDLVRYSLSRCRGER